MKSPIKSLKKLGKRIRGSRDGDIHRPISEDVSGESHSLPQTPVLSGSDEVIKEEEKEDRNPFDDTSTDEASPLKSTIQSQTKRETILEPENNATTGESSSRHDQNTENASNKNVVSFEKDCSKNDVSYENEERRNEAPGVLEDIRKAPEAVAKNKAIYDVDAKSILYGLLTFIGVFWLLMGWIFGIGMWEFIRYTFMFTGLSILYMYLYSKNQRKKEESVSIMNISPGVVGLTSLLKEFPSWLSYTKKERVEWFNKILTQMWPFYDKAVCDAIKESIEPVMKSMKPPIFKDIKFGTLRFGEVPFRVEGVEVEESPSELIIDLDLRWSGDATMSLAIEPNIPSMTEATTMCPKVTDISCSGTLRIVLKPIVSEIPCFGAIIASFLKAPALQFHCDFGRALGGSASGKMVKNALDPFIESTLASMLVWPHRIVIPIIDDEKITGPLANLELRHVGVLSVKVVEAKSLPAADTNGFSDPTIELWTRPENKYDTSVIKKTLDPVWEDEVFHLLIQEPKTQCLYLTAYDVDMFNATEMFKSLNIIKNMKESVHAKEFLGRCMVPLREVTEDPKKQTDDWYDLGSRNFGDLNGPGSGCGSVHLKLIYTPFSMMKVKDSKVGLILVHVIKCRDLIAMDAGGSSDPYVKIKLCQKTVKTQVIPACLDPEFNAKFEFFNVPITDRIELSVFDRDRVSKDDPIGDMVINVQEIADSFWSDLPGQMYDWYKLQNVPHGDIKLKLQYIPTDTIRAFSC
eukprot:g2193.t1